ncbi:MAG: bifunctional phosphoribosyl-AMP cyclohydrolase/phosphoribosyl-ATP diphosphatase HisIE [Eubacteriales bacterium]|nr:bifunctional phosphoribosyl-AMP cyclohydrolase/phosphoribosyl-ATP diphosphatase HisIE [Eubacteriales bacterium]
MAVFDISVLKFGPKGLMPVIVTEEKNGEVLMLAYANKEALEKTLETGKMHYWSRSRSELWLKGSTSGNYQELVSMSYDCDADTLLASVRQTGNACHTGNHSCFFRQLFPEIKAMASAADTVEKLSKEPCDVPENVEKQSNGGDIDETAAIISELYELIGDRRAHPKEGSYTNYLFEKGLDKILKKVGEETSEVIIASKNRDRDEIRYEIADLVYHLLVLMTECRVTPQDIYEELKSRRR